MNAVDIPLTASPDRIRALKRSGLLDRGGNDRFDRLTVFVRDMLDVPVSVISLVDEERQVFLGHCGVQEPWASAGETPLTHSFCQHVVARNAPMLVADATSDPTVRGNLAISDLGVAAYLGVPLRLPTGELAGALAAIDTVPRAWTPQDLRRLQSIAGMVESEIAGRVSETRWRALFEQLKEGFILGKVIRDANNRIVDWRYEEVNQAWSELVGVPADQAIGRTIREVFPGIEDEWVNEFADVVETGRAISFVRPVGTIGRWYDGHAQPIGPETFVVMFVDATKRVLAESALRDGERRLRTVVESVPVGILLAEAPSGRIVMGNRRLAEMLGRERLDAMTADDYDAFVSFHADGRRVASSEFPLARIVAGECDHATLEVNYEKPTGERVWISIVGEAVKDADGQTTGAVVAVTDIERRKEAEARQQVLNYELAHRLKNTLAIVHSIVTQTLRSTTDVASARQSLSERILTLSKAHDILLVGRHDAGSIENIVRSVVAVHDEGNRVVLSGPSLLVGPKAAMTLALMMNELATNAVKYGSLSTPAGMVSVSWAVEVTSAAGTPTLRIEWREEGGPPVAAPTRRGFGTRLIGMGFSSATGGSVDLDYAPAGVVCRIAAPLVEIQSDEEESA